MALEMGKYAATIRENTVTTLGGKEVVRLTVETDDGEETDVLVWMTKASMSIARQSLKLCGFDPEKHTVEDMFVNPKLLAGNKVTIIMEDYQGKLRASLMLNPAPTKHRMAELTKGLRDAASAETKVANGGGGEDDEVPF